MPYPWLPPCGSTARTFLFGKTKVTAVAYTGHLFTQTESLVPIELLPVTAFTRGHRLQQIIVFSVIGLLGAVNLEGPDLRIRVTDITAGLVQCRAATGIDLSPIR